jgi:TonB family protein
LPPDADNPSASTPNKPRIDHVPDLEILPPLGDLTSLSRTLASHGAGDLSPDVALDLVLHEIAEHVRQATSADSAALAIRYGDEVICRAAAGNNAPDLGSRIDARTGLSGLCLQTGEWQYCQDCEEDPRVDVDTCRRLGARSFLVMPVIDETGPFGLIQVSSRSPNAFSQKDVETLRQNGRSIVSARRQVSQKSSRRSAAESSSGTLDAMTLKSALPRSSAPRQQTEVPGPPPQRSYATSPSFTISDSSTHSGTAKSSRGQEIVTGILGLLVVAAALLLGTLIGIRFGWQKALHLSREKTSPSASPNHLPNPTTPNPQAVAQVTASTVAPSPSPAIPDKRSAPAPPASANSLTAYTSAASDTDRAGNLVVYQNDKVVFRDSGNANPSPSPQSALTQQPASLSPRLLVIPPSVAAGHLLHRVDPVYPADAGAKKMAGTVRLQAIISAQGEVISAGLLEGDPTLAAAAIKAVREWRYQPYLQNGIATSVQTEIAITFPAHAR